MIAEEKLLEKISKEKKEFKKLLDKHYELKGKIQAYDKLKYLSPEDEAEVKKLKKLKLKEKDLMIHMLSEYKHDEA